jgi:hypothetical protein
MDILINGLTHWFADTAFLKEDYPDSYHALIIQQEQLGWHQILLALWCGTPTYVAPSQPVANSQARLGFLAGASLVGYKSSHNGKHGTK